MATLCGALLLSVSTVVWGEPVLHELFAADPAEDQRFGATISSGVMPAGMQTKSGWVSAKDPTEPVPFSDHAYGGMRASAEVGSEFALDNLTTKPTQVNYDEPFRPSILPYKRLSAFDTLQNNFSLGVRDQGLRIVPVGGTPSENEDSFFGDYEVDLVADVPVRIPTVGPHTRLLALQIDPPREVTVLEDGAENWFMKASQGGRVRAFVQLSIERRVFGSQFAPVSREALRPYLPIIPKAVHEAARAVISEIGITSDRPPAGVLDDLVQHFRSFQESADLPQATEPLSLYQEISLARKGVCRHRAYAFVVTALSWGLPARMVVNEAHAWVEVFDSEIWHRIDLGGAASDLLPLRNEPLTIRHRPPPDPFTWPTSERPASAEFERRLAQNHPSFLDANGGRQPSSGTTTGSGSLNAAPASSGGPNAASPPGTPGSGPDHGIAPGSGTGTSPSRAQVELVVRGGEHKRGTPLSVAGRVTEGNVACVLSRIDIQVVLPEGSRTIGSLATDRSGQFTGYVTLPSSLPVGHFPIQAQLGTPCRKL